MNKKTKQNYKKKIFSVLRLIVMVTFLGWAIETGNKRWYFLVIMVYIIIKNRDLYKTTVMTYVCGIKSAWNIKNPPPKK